MTTKTNELAQFVLDYREARKAIQSNPMFSEDYKVQELGRLHSRYTEERAAAEAEIRQGMEAKRSKAYRTLHKREGSSKPDAAEELRRQNIRTELMGELQHGAHPRVLYETAIKAGDTTRANILATVGPRFLETAADRMRFTGIVRQHEPAEVSEARTALAEADSEERTFEIGNSIRKSLDARRGYSNLERASEQVEAAAKARIAGAYNAAPPSDEVA